jgi:chromosome segregation ATPase
MTSTLFSRGVNSQFDAVRRANEVNRFINDIKQKVDLMQNLPTEISALRSQLQNVDVTVQNVNSRTVGADGRYTTLESRIYNLERRLDSLDTSLKQLIERVGKLETMGSLPPSAETN